MTHWYRCESGTIIDLDQAFAFKVREYLLNLQDGQEFNGPWYVVAVFPYHEDGEDFEEISLAGEFKTEQEAEKWLTKFALNHLIK